MRLVAKIFAVVLILAGVLMGGCVLVMAEFAFEGDPGAAQLWYFGIGLTAGLIFAGIWLFRAAGREDKKDDGE